MAPAKYWANMASMNPPTPAPEKPDNVTNISERNERQKFSFHGEEIRWYDIEGMTYMEAHSVGRLIDNYYYEHFLLFEKANGEITDIDISNFARELRHMGDPIEGFAGKNARSVIVKIAAALERNPDKRQRRDEVLQITLNT